MQNPTPQAASQDKNNPAQVVKRNAIRKLDETVVARIAAGEVVHRPANAIKELIENSMDAGSKSIQIILKDGGMKILEIIDDGCGIAMEDLPLVCERHTTSKLKEWEDLKHIQTFGFRGEALARCDYEDGKPKAKPKPIGANKGTKIHVEDLFYNVRRKDLIKNTNEEYHRVVDVVKQYAVNNPTVSWTVKKFNEPLADIHTQANSTTLDNIKMLYGEVVSNVLVPVSCESESLSFAMKGYVSPPHFDAQKKSFILFINKRLVNCTPMYKQIKEVYASLQGSNAAVHPFIFLQLNIIPENVDVNVHPTKEEVNFLNEDKIFKEIARTIAKAFVPEQIKDAAPNNDDPIPMNGSSNNSFNNNMTPNKQNSANAPKGLFWRTPGSKPFTPNSNFGNNNNNNSSNTGGGNSDSKQMKLHWGSQDSNSSNNEFRVDYGGHKDDSMAQDNDDDIQDFQDDQPVNALKPTSHHSTPNSQQKNSTQKTLFFTPKSEPGSQKKTSQEPKNSQRTQSQPDYPVKKKRKVTTPPELTSVRNLIAEIDEKCDDALSNVLCSHKYLGLVDPYTVLVQHKSELYLLDVHMLSKELFYQTILFHFGKFVQIPLVPAPPLFDLLVMALDQPEAGWKEEDGEKNSIAQAIAELLMSHSAMLLEYFGVEITSLGCLKHIPMLLSGYVPPLHRLPMFLFYLATRVDWDQEQQCFQGIATELSELYAVEPPEYLIASMANMTLTPATNNNNNNNADNNNAPDDAKKPVLFEKSTKEDHPLQRALEYCMKNSNAYLFAKEYDASLSSARYYHAQNVDAFFEQYAALDPKLRCYSMVLIVVRSHSTDDVMREGLPVKFYADLEFDPVKFPENSPKQEQVNEMVHILKQYIQQQWEEDTQTHAPVNCWLEFDASRDNYKVSRHLHNDAMAFFDIDHLYTFMKRLNTTIFLDVSKGVDKAMKLVVHREKNGKKKKELFFDMLVYSRNQCLRLPWSSKVNESRHLYPVLEGKVRRDMLVPQFEMFFRVLANYWPEGQPSVEPFSYTADLLQPRYFQLVFGSEIHRVRSTNSPLQSPRKMADADKSTYDLLIERDLFSLLRTELVPSSKLSTAYAVQKVCDLAAYETQPCRVLHAQ